VRNVFDFFKKIKIKIKNMGQFKHDGIKEWYVENTTKTIKAESRLYKCKMRTKKILSLSVPTTGK